VPGKEKGKVSIAKLLRRSACKETLLNNVQMKTVVREWQSLSAGDPPQSLRRHSSAATLAVSLLMVATVACVLLADRPKGFALEQTHSSDEDKYSGLLMSKHLDKYSRMALSQNIRKIFSQKNKIASDNAAAFALDSSPEFRRLKRQVAESESALKNAAAAERLSQHNLKAGLISASREHQKSSSAIAAAIQAEKESDTNLVRLARNSGIPIPSPSKPDPVFLKMLSVMADLDSGSHANRDRPALDSISDHSNGYSFPLRGQQSSDE
jgi:hypothetical protein